MYAPHMATLAAFPRMLERDRGRDGLRVCRAAWLLGVTVREYREPEAGDAFPTSEVYERICETFGWPGVVVSRRYRG
jgi:predicted transcriptional regulator